MGKTSSLKAIKIHLKLCADLQLVKIRKSFVCEDYCSQFFYYLYFSYLLFDSLELESDKLLKVWEGVAFSHWISNKDHLNWSLCAA